VSATDVRKKRRAVSSEKNHLLRALGGIVLYYPILASCSYEREYREDVDTKKVNRFYDSAVELFAPTDDGMTLALCQFSAGQTLKEWTIKIEASYYIAFSHDDIRIPNEVAKKLVKQLVESSAWPLFRDLFIHIASQSAEELPLLPNVPNKLRWLKSDE
jgi:hypothetical protein